MCKDKNLCVCVHVGVRWGGLVHFHSEIGCRNIYMLMSSVT